MSLIKGYDALMRQLNRLENLDLVAPTVKGLEIIKVESQLNTPVDEGNLQAHQYVYKTKDGAELVIEEPYATFVEFGTSIQEGQPFLRPAIDNKSDEALKVVAEDIQDQIRKAL